MPHVVICHLRKGKGTLVKHLSLKIGIGKNVHKLFTKPNQHMTFFHPTFEEFKHR